MGRGEMGVGRGLDFGVQSYMGVCLWVLMWVWSGFGSWELRECRLGTSSVMWCLSFHLEQPGRDWLGP